MLPIEIAEDEDAPTVLFDDSMIDQEALFALYDERIGGVDEDAVPQAEAWADDPMGSMELPVPPESHSEVEPRSPASPVMVAMAGGAIVGLALGALGVFLLGLAA